MSEDVKKRGGNERSHAELGRGVDDAGRLKEGDAEPSDGWEKGFIPQVKVGRSANVCIQSNILVERNGDDKI